MHRVVPGELHASRSRLGNTQKRGGSVEARSSLGPHPPPHCDTGESDPGCPCSLEKLPILAASKDGQVRKLDRYLLH